MQVLEHPAGGPRGGHEFQKPSGPGGFLLQGDQGSAFLRGDSVDGVSDSAGSMEFPVVSGLPKQGDLAPDPGRSDSRGFQLGQIPGFKVRSPGFFFLLGGFMSLPPNVAKEAVQIKRKGVDRDRLVRGGNKIDKSFKRRII